MCEAARAEVNHLDARFVRTLQQDVLRLEVAVDQGLFPQILESLQDLDGEAPDQTKRDAFEVIVADELVEVDREELE